MKVIDIIYVVGAFILSGIMMMKEDAEIGSGVFIVFFLLAGLALFLRGIFKL